MRPQTILLSTALVLLILTSCASAKKNVYSPGGVWDYVVFDTPSGNSTGTLTLTETEQGLSGSITSNEFGTSTLEGVTYGEGQSLKCRFFLAELTLYMSGTFEGDEFAGSVDAGSAGLFKITATRKTED